MFKREVKSVGQQLMVNLRLHGLETPLLQKRLVESWPLIAGEVVARYTTSVHIYNQTLHVKLSMPALRSELGMQRHDLVQRLNAHVGAQIITDIRFG